MYGYARPVENWLSIIGKPNDETPFSFADFILKDLTGYKDSSIWRDTDLQSLRNALMAFKQASK